MVYALLIAGREMGIEIYVEKTKYVVMSCKQNVGQNHKKKIGNKFFERMEEFKLKGTR